jgi:RimJ/RimL family protein N-acetyltransferase
MEIATRRLRLREFVEDDWRAVLAWQRDPRYLRWYPWEDRSEEDVRAFVGGFLAQQRETPRYRYQWAITLATGGGAIGDCGIRRKEPAAVEADVGFELAPAHWGRGYATEAARAVVDFGFDALRLHRIWAWCVAENTASARVLEKLGMRPEGRLVEHAEVKGRWLDTLLYGILEREWRAARPRR